MNYTYLNGLKTHSFSSREDLIHYALEEKKSLIAINAEKILYANPSTSNIINKNIGYPDGVGAVWGLKKKGFKETLKIPGCELWLDIIETCHASKSFYLVGSKQEVIEQTVHKLKQQYPNINILNYRNGYIKNNQERDDLINDIVSLKPDIVFIAMGSPKQELLIESIQEQHQAVYQGLGGSFDVFTGNVKRAPKWWIKYNLEWAYRLLKEPKRIKRQIHLVRFLYLLLFNKI